MAVEIEFSLLLDLDILFLAAQLNKWMGQNRLLQLPFFLMTTKLFKLIILK